MIGQEACLWPAPFCISGCDWSISFHRCIVLYFIALYAVSYGLAKVGGSVGCMGFRVSFYAFYEGGSGTVTKPLQFDFKRDAPGL